MDNSTFRYYQIKISAKRLPGRIRIDPFAVVFTGGAGQWSEIGRTEKRLNEWNPKFSKSIALPADNDEQRRLQLRVDFYNKDMSEARFLGTCEVSLYGLLTSAGRDVELELVTPTKVSGSPRVFLTAQEGYTAESGSATFCLQLAQTNHYGVSMIAYYEICRAGEQSWYSVFKSEHVKVDDQGWAQFPSTKITLRELTMDEEGTGLLFNIYRHRRIGARKLLGYFQSSVKDLTRVTEGDFLPFSGNAKEDLMSADVQVLHNKKVGMDFTFSFKLVNVIWRAPLLSPPETQE